MWNTSHSFSDSTGENRRPGRCLLTSSRGGGILFARKKRPLRGGAWGAPQRNRRRKAPGRINDPPLQRKGKLSHKRRTVRRGAVPRPLACAFRHGDVRCAPACQGWAGADATSVKAMEMHAVRRPVYGGAARQERIKKAPQRYRAGGPGVPWTPGRRPPHRNGGARRLSGYAAKSRSDAPTGGASSEPVPLFPAAVQAAIAKGLGLCLISAQS